MPVIINVDDCNSDVARKCSHIFMQMTGMASYHTLCFSFIGSPADEHTCGRPLGMRLDKDGYLVVVDAYLGLFKVNVATGGY